LFNLYNNQPHVVPLIWQGNTANESPGYSQRRGQVGSNSDGIPQCAFQGTELEVGAAPDAYNAQYLPKYNQLINTNAPMTVNAVLMGSAGSYSLSANVTLESDFDSSDVEIVYILTRYIDDSYFSSVVAYEHEAFDLATAGQSGMFSHDFTIDASWDAEDIKGFVLVQRYNNSDNEIYQAAEAGSAAVSAEVIDFGDAYIGSNFTKTFTVANIGTATANVSIDADVDGFTVSGDMSYTLPVGETSNHTVTFTPTADQNYEGTITITTDITGFENNTIQLSGVGFTNQAPAIENMTIDGYLMKGHAIEIVYDFEDADNDNEGESVLNWYQSDDNATWEPLSNINADIFTLHLADEHIGKYLKFTYLPVDEHQMSGTEVVIESGTPVVDLGAPTNLTVTIENGNDIVLNWDLPEYPQVRGLFGYKVVRGTSMIATLVDVDERTFTDEGVEDGEYAYSIRGIYTQAGLSPNSNEVTVAVENGEGVVGNEDNAISINAISNGPNPFSNVTTISFQSKRSENVTVDIYNVKGQLINTLFNSNVAAGTTEVQWNGTDKNGKKCSNGVYFYRITTPNKTVQKKMILTK
jgi:hypothetical protein